MLPTDKHIICINTLQKSEDTTPIPMSTTKINWETASESDEEAPPITINNPDHEQALATATVVTSSRETSTHPGATSRCTSMEPVMTESLTMTNINNPTDTRDLIMHENELFNHRMIWLLMIQGFLFAGLGFVWQNSGAVIYVFCAVGLLTAFSLHRLLLGGIRAIRNMEKNFEWDSLYIELKEYQSMFGDCNVRRDFTWAWEEDEDPELGDWVMKQWKEKKQLDPKKKIRLYVLGFWNGSYDINKVNARLGPKSSKTDQTRSLHIARRKEAAGLIIGLGDIKKNPCLRYLLPWYFMPVVFMVAWITLVITNRLNL